MGAVPAMVVDFLDQQCGIATAGKGGRRRNASDWADHGQRIRRTIG
jgi:hypothetical protein